MRTQKPLPGERPQTLAQQGTAMPPKLFAAPALFMSAPALMKQCLFGIMRKMPVECAGGKIQKLVNAIRAEGVSASMARVEHVIPEAAPAFPASPPTRCAPLRAARCWAANPGETLVGSQCAHRSMGATSVFSPVEPQRGPKNENHKKCRRYCAR
jgi:hypothetical protein